MCKKKKGKKVCEIASLPFVVTTVRIAYPPFKTTFLPTHSISVYYILHTYYLTNFLKRIFKKKRGKSLSPYRADPLSLRPSSLFTTLNVQSYYSGTPLRYYTTHIGSWKSGIHIHMLRLRLT